MAAEWDTVSQGSCAAVGVLLCHCPCSSLRASCDDTQGLREVPGQTVEKLVSQFLGWKCWGAREAGAGCSQGRLGPHTGGVAEPGPQLSFCQAHLLLLCQDLFSKSDPFLELYRINDDQSAATGVQDRGEGPHPAPGG